MLGHVTDVIDKDKFVIKFTIPNVIEDALAYPIDTFDEPNIGDPVEVTRLEDRFGESYTYKKLRLKNHTRLKLQNSIIDIFNNHIEIHAGGGQSKIIVNDDGSIIMEAAKEVTIKTETAKLEVKDTLELTGGGTLKTGQPGTAGANNTGAFCGIPVCPLTGAPHGSQEVKGI